ncbi:hypothetical protein N0V82_000973 [Gnomoniopsis sp. IMI 355080]|nr:hypothetical protein N0V82_000973 [Gnomoniopsis sp. IMI 355080]
MAAPATEEKTFRAYTPSDAQKYARYPGTATFKLTETFKTTIGLDPSEGMINAARSLMPKKTPNGPLVKFEVSTAEDISPELIPDGSVDLLTAATCAHWFNFDLFYPSAARILAPNGTIALFISSTSLHPDTPNADAINTALRDIEAAELVQHFEPGNLLAHDLYATLPMPWTISPPEPAFPESLFRRKTFGMSEEEAEGQIDGEGFYTVAAEFDLDTVEMMLATASPVTRWREANPEKASTEEDIVRSMRRTMEKLLWEAGVDKGQELVRPGIAGVLLMLKKRA